MALKDYPYTAVGIIVSVAGLIVLLLTTLSVSVIGSLFSMNGTMHDIKAQQTLIIQRQEAAYVEQINEAKVARTYATADLARTNFMVGLMTPRQQAAVSLYDKANPLPPMPDAHPNPQIGRNSQ